MVDRGAADATSFGESSHYFGTNIPGKPRQVPAELRRPPEALQGDRPRRGSDYRRSGCRVVRRSRRASTGSRRSPGRRSGGAVSRNRLRSCSRSQAASSCRYHSSPSGTPSLNRHRWWIGRNECRLGSLVLAEQALDRVVVGDQRRDLRLGDPLEQRLGRGRRGRSTSVKISPGSGSLVPLEDLGGEAGVQQEHVAGLDHDVVGRHDLLERRQVDRRASRGRGGGPGRRARRGPARRGTPCARGRGGGRRSGARCRRPRASSLGPTRSTPAR